MDPSFVIPRVIIELILPGINDYFIRKNFHISYSQIIPAQSSLTPDLILNIERLNETVTLVIEISATETDKNKIKTAIGEIIKESAFILQLISGREIKEVSFSENVEIKDKYNFYQFTIALRRYDEEILLIINLPGRFFNILIPSIDTSFIRENITDLVIPFFKKPDILYPSIEMLLSRLSVSELSEILDILKKNNKLSDYQLVLLINGFPEHSLKIKNALSKNRQESLREELKKYKGRVTKEDIACGIYSIEESLSEVFKNEKNHIADHLRILSSLIKKFLNYELYMRKSWPEWLSEMDQKKLLYKTILKCSDQVLREAFHGYNDEKYPFFKRDFPPARISEIFDESINRTTGSLPDARYALIRNYRKLTAETLRCDHKNFSFIIASVINDHAFEIIVRNTGWFILSTALKQCSRKLIDRVTANINHPASVLIKSVIAGTINPDIIHDEIQVNRAGNESAAIIFQLFEDGIIELDI